MLHTKKDFLNCLKGMIEPLRGYYSPCKAGIKLGNYAVSYSDEVAQMEGFSRVLWGLAPLWGGNEECEGFDEIYLTGIINGTDPESPEYWGEIPASSSDQRIVEMAALGLALILAPHKIWESLTEKQKENFHKWLSQVNNHIQSNNNWQLFPLIVNLGFKRVGAEYDAERMKQSLASLDSFYREDGWYHDGNTDQADYYVPFALHFYALIYAKVMEKEDPENSRIIKERAALFAKSFIYWFDENGSALAFGRSLTYRFAQCCFFSALVFAGVFPFPIGVIKGIIARHFEWWLSQPIFDDRGVLTVGYAYPNLNMAEFYNGYGSPYWGLKAFLFLALDEDHEFFKAEALPLPALSKQYNIPTAYMTVQRCSGYAVALTGGQWASWNPTHCPEKYSKFAYSSRYAFNVSRTTDSIYNASPDSTLAFEIDGRIFYRGKCLEHSMDEEGGHFSKWSPYRGITVETKLIPTDGGHIRRHTVFADFDCIAYDTSFATPIGGGGEVHGEGEQVLISCEPNANLIHPRCEIKAIKYSFKKGENHVETTVIYPK